MAEEVGQAYVSIVPSMRGFSTRLRAELAGELRGIDGPVGAAGLRAGGRFGDSMREGIRSRLSGIGAMLKSGLMIGAVAVTAGLGAITAFGLRSAAALEQTQIGLEGLLGSADEAKKLIGELQQFAARTPFEFTGLAGSARRILGSGVATREDLLPTLTILGDIVSATAGGQENIDGLIRALGQIASKGRLMGGEILQIAEQLPGFNANQAIAAHLGISVADALELQEKGAIDSRTAIEGLLVGMQNYQGAAGAMERQSQTLTGVFSTFKDTIAIALTEAFQPIIPEIKQMLSDVTPILGEAIGALAPLLGQLLAAALPLVAALVQALTPIIVPILDALAVAVRILEPTLQPLGEAIGLVVEAIVPLLPIVVGLIAVLARELTPVIAELAPVFAEIIPPLGEILYALIPLIPSLVELLVAVTPLLVIMAKWDALLLRLASSLVIGPVVRYLTEVIGDLSDGIRALAGWLTGIDWGLTWRNITAGVTTAFTAVVDWFEGLPRWFKDRLSTAGTWLVEAGKSIVRGLWNGISSLGGWLWDQIGGFVRRNTIGRVESLLGISSPSKVFAKIGEDTVAGYVHGVEQSARTAAAAQTSFAPAAGTAAAAATRQTVDVTSNDPIIRMVMDRIREEVRTVFGNDVTVALQAT